MIPFTDICNGPVGRGVYGAFLNFKSALSAMGGAIAEPPYNAPPRAPVLYIKPANTWTHAGAPIPVPQGQPCIEVGATVGIVLGHVAVRVSEQLALDHVAGLVVVNDVCLPHTNFYRPALKQRCRDGFCSFGTKLVEARSIADLDSITLRSYVNGAIVQEASTRDLVRGVARLIAEVSEFMTLAAGDVLLVGVPTNAPRAVEGDLVCVEAEGIGRVENRVIAETCGMGAPV